MNTAAAISQKPQNERARIAGDLAVSVDTDENFTTWRFCDGSELILGASGSWLVYAKALLTFGDTP